MNQILSQENIEYMASLAFINGLRIHNDSIVLFNNKSYSTSYFLSVLAIEELGKVQLLDDLYYHNNIDDYETSLDEEKRFLKQIYNHRTKQSYFLQNTVSFNNHNEVYKEIEIGAMEILKQNSLYVGLHKLDKKIVFSKNIINPSKHNKNKTRDLITLVNDQLIIDCYMVTHEFGGYDIESINIHLNSKLLKELEWTWPIKSENAKKRISELLEVD